jgi:hypothetical protein
MKALAAIGLMVTAAATFAVLLLSSTLIGLAAGWVAGLFFETTLLTFFGQLGLHDLALWQIGACLGFAGGFFKTTNITNKNS